MSLWRQLTRGLRTLMNPTAASQDMVDEVCRRDERGVITFIRWAACAQE